MSLGEHLDHTGRRSGRRGEGSRGVQDVHHNHHTTHLRLDVRESRFFVAGIPTQPFHSFGGFEFAFHGHRRGERRGRQRRGCGRERLHTRRRKQLRTRSNTVKGKGMNLDKTNRGGRGDESEPKIRVVVDSTHPTPYRHTTGRVVTTGRRRKRGRGGGGACKRIPHRFLNEQGGRPRGEDDRRAYLPHGRPRLSSL